MSELEGDVLEAVRRRAVPVLSLLLSHCKSSRGEFLKDILQQAAQQPEPEVLKLLLGAGNNWTEADVLPALQIAKQKGMRSNARLLLAPRGVLWWNDMLGPPIYSRCS